MRKIEEFEEYGRYYSIYDMEDSLRPKDFLCRLEKSVFEFDICFLDEIDLDRDLKHFDGTDDFAELLSDYDKIIALAHESLMIGIHGYYNGVNCAIYLYPKQDNLVTLQSPVPGLALNKLIQIKD